MDKLTIIGKGTVGCLAACHFNHYMDWEIDWIYDPNTSSWAVGEGTSLIIPMELYTTMNWRAKELYELKGTPKLGIMKNNWGHKDFLHSFSMGSHGIHMNAVELQNKIFNELKGQKNINIIEERVEDYEELDTDKVLVCAGKPSKYEEYNTRNGIPVNAVYVVQCYWNNPQFLYSLTNAMKHGWVFGIPLQNRVSIGYLYNDKISTLEEVKEDIQKVFKQYSLIPSEDTNEIHFQNYSRKNNFEKEGRIVFNGTASFFLEPLEATSLSNADQINRLAWDVWHRNISLEEAKESYDKEIQITENMISFHYLAGSRFSSKFWDYARDKAEAHYRHQLETNQYFVKILKDIFQNHKIPSGFTGTWNRDSWNLNLQELGIYERIKEDLKNV